MKFSTNKPRTVTAIIAATVFAIAGVAAAGEAQALPIKASALGARFAGSHGHGTAKAVKSAKQKAVSGDQATADLNEKSLASVQRENAAASTVQPAAPVAAAPAAAAPQPK